MSDSGRLGLEERNLLRREKKLDAQGQVAEIGQEKGLEEVVRRAKARAEEQKVMRGKAQGKGDRAQEFFEDDLVDVSA